MLKTKRKLLPRMLEGIFALCCGVFSILFLAIGLLKTNIYLDDIGIGLMLLVIFIRLGYGALRNSSIHFSDTGIQTSSILGNRQYKSTEILGYTKKDVGQPITILKTTKGYLRFSSTYYADYDTINKVIGRNYKWLPETAFKTYHSFLELIIRFIILIIICVLSFNFLTTQIYGYEGFKEDIGFIELTLKTPIIAKKGGGRSNRKVKAVFKTKEYRRLEFKINPIKYDLLDKSVIEKAKIGDVIKIGLSKRQLTGKLLKTEPPAFKDKYFRRKGVEVKNLEYQGKAYLDVIEIEQKLKNVQWKSWFAVPVIMLLFYGFTAEYTL